MFTLSQAAKATGKSKSVISRAIGQNKLPATKDVTGVFQIEESDLFALWPEQHQAEPTERPEQNQQNAIAEPEPRSTVLQAKVELLEEQLEQVRENEAKLLHILASSQKTAQLTNESAEERIAQLRAEREERIAELIAERDSWKSEADDWKTHASNQTLLLSQQKGRKWLGIFG